MKTPTFTSAIVIMATLQISSSLKCNKCNACESTSAKTEVCRDVDPLHEIAACLTQRVRIAHNPEPMTVKKCVVYDMGSVFRCQDLPDSDPLSCDVCREDFCNAAPDFGTNFSLILTPLLFLLLPKLFYY